MIKKFNKTFLTLIVVVALLPIVPTLLVSLSPVAIMVLIFFGVVGFRPVRTFVSSVVGGIVGFLSFTIGGFFSVLGQSLAWLFGIGQPGSASFMGWWEKAGVLSPRNKGMLVDGKAARLSETATYESALVQGGMGKGKTSVFVVPNLLMPSKSEPSFVVSDTSGQIFRHTSGYLERCGYQIRVLDLMDIHRSETYNPLANASSQERIGEIAKTLISSAEGDLKKSNADPFWNQSAEKLIRILAQCLMNQPDAQYRNLANLRHLITCFDAHIAPQGQLGKIDHFVLNATQNDPGTYNSYRSFVSGNLKTIQSILMSADVALDAVALPEIARLTASSSFQLEELRQQKTIIYIKVNQTKMTLYSFLLNLFYADLFKTLLQNEQDPGRPVWLFLDEFGHLQIPDFHIYATTARKYKVAFALFLQSMSQLEGRYGRYNAQTIQEALGTEIYLPGMALDNARAVEARLGQVAAANNSRKPLMAASDIIRMKDDRALLLNSNKLPIKLKTQRYFTNSTLRARSNIKEAVCRNKPAQTVPLIQL